MLTAARSLIRSSKEGGRELPTVPEFHDLYQLGWQPRYGEMCMISARSGAGKSSLGLFFALRTGLRTLYFSGDMSAFQASSKLACAVHHKSIDDVVELLEGDARDDILAPLPRNIAFSFGEITFKGIRRNIDAYVELYNEYPELVVVDNLMDIEGCDSDYTAQQAAMQQLHVLNRELGCTVWVMAHATDKGEKGRNSPHEPPPRSEIKNGMSEKPETILAIALNPFKQQLNVAIVKQRLGPSDPSGQQYASITAVADQSRFERNGYPSVREVTSGEDTSAATQREESPSGSSVGVGRTEGTAESGIRRREVAPLW